MRASDILLPIAAASLVAGSPLNFEERDANTCTIKSIQSVVAKLNPSVATPYCQSFLKISTKTVTKTLKPSVPSKHVVTATVHKTVTSTKKVTKDVTATTSSSFNASDTRVKKSTSTSSKKSSSSSTKSSSSSAKTSSPAKTSSSSLYSFAIFDLIAIELELTDLADLSEIIQSCCDSVDKQQSIVIKYDPIETIKQHILIFDIVFHQQHRKFDNDFVKQHSFSFVLVGQHAKRELFKQQPAHFQLQQFTRRKLKHERYHGNSFKFCLYIGDCLKLTNLFSCAPSAGFANISSSAAESSAGMSKRDLEERGNVAVSTKKTTSIKKVTSTNKPSTTAKMPIVKKATSSQKLSSSKKASTSLKSTSTKKVVTTSKKASTSSKPISTLKKATSSTSSVKSSSVPINKGQPALFNGLNNAQQSSICSCLHVPTPTLTKSIFVDTFTTVTSTVTAVQTLVSSTTTTAYHTTTARPNLFYMQISSKSKTSVDGQWAVLPGGDELLGFTSGKAGASEFFFAEPNLLVEYQSNFLANVEEGDWATSFYMNSVSKMYNVSAVPLACYNQGGVLSCKSGDLEQLYWCSVWGTTSLVLGPSTYDNGLCKPVSLDIVP
ncbi:hypothetical protein KCU97_g10702, partial [Aureobasidium melanogenum]